MLLTKAEYNFFVLLAICFLFISQVQVQSFNLHAASLNKRTGALQLKATASAATESNKVTTSPIGIGINGFGRIGRRKYIVTNLT